MGQGGKSSAGTANSHRYLRHSFLSLENKPLKGYYPEVIRTEGGDEMLGRLSWWLARNVLWTIGLYSPPPPLEIQEPAGARGRTEFILAWKRCSLCGSVLMTTPGQLEFLTTNRQLHSESYLAVCADGHPYYVTIFLQGTAHMPVLAQDEVWNFLP